MCKSLHSSSLDTLRRLLPQLFSDFANSIQRPFKTAAEACCQKRTKEGPTTSECIIYIIANVSIKISDSRNGHKNSYDHLEKYYNKNQPPTRRLKPFFRWIQFTVMRLKLSLMTFFRSRCPVHFGKNKQN